jgi:Tol biopolymer transport system component
MNLTNNPAVDEKPNWSPDGAEIAFTSTRDGNEEIYVMDADGSYPTRLTNNTISDSEPAWTPNGMHILFQSNRDGNYEIYVMTANGSHQTRLTSSPSDDTEADGQPIPQAAAATSTPTHASSGGNQPPAETPASPAAGVTINDLYALVQQCVSDGGVQNSLTVKLDHGQFNAFINEVQAQSGKKIPADCANQMIEIATQLSS